MLMVMVEISYCKFSFDFGINEFVRDKLMLLAEDNLWGYMYMGLLNDQFKL